MSEKNDGDSELLHGMTLAHPITLAIAQHVTTNTVHFFLMLSMPPFRVCLCSVVGALLAAPLVPP
jgi:hypothetical protein